MNPVIMNVLDALRESKLNAAYQYRQYLNEIAVYLYNKPELSTEDQDDLKDLLTIANITYNDTDKELLPIEDGIYDLILEKYKKYNPFFQVGAEVIRFKSSRRDRPYIDKHMKDAISFIEPPKEEDYKFMRDIVVDQNDYIDHRDFYNPEPAVMEFVSKRTHNTAHQHPELVGTLDKCKFTLDKDALARGVLDDANVKTVERDFFGEHLTKGIIRANQRFDVVLELKYDGISVEADCTDVVVSARSRGDTGTDQASDLTPFLKGYRFPHRAPGSPVVGVKFEAIMTQNDLPFFNAAKGYEYKNCRSAIVGLLSSGDSWKYRDFITLVPLAVEQKVFEEECHSDRMEEIAYLNKNFISKGCPLRHTMVSGTYIENLTWIDMFANNAEMLRGMVPFMYDGIVASYRDPVIRNKLGRENFINKYSIAVKFNPLKKQTVFRGYSYTVGQDGSITPMIHYDPVEFYGTIHDKSSGHSYERFQKLGLHKGDAIDVEYVNDVMPYVSKPINDWNLENEKVTPVEIFPNRCPICGSLVELSDSGKSAKCVNPDCGGRQLARMVNMCAKLGLDGFGEATISQIGKYHLWEFLELLTRETWAEELRIRGFGPVESNNIHSQIVKFVSTPISESKLLGSVGFTNVSVKTWELVLNEIDYGKLREMFNLLDPSKIYYKRTLEFLTTIKGVGPMTADTIAREFKYFQKDIDWMLEHGNVIMYQKNSGKEIRFSGFRDKSVAEYLESRGFVVDPDSNVTKTTYALLVPHAGFTSSKTTTANKFGVMIVPVNDFMSNIDKYI